jgi:hypothetical protein
MSRANGQYIQVTTTNDHTAVGSIKASRGWAEGSRKKGSHQVDEDSHNDDAY